jgi:salicylate hydroxylase
LNDIALGERDVLVVGAGIAGLSAALFLHKAGFTPRILEKAQALDETGAGIQVSPNASHLLLQLGLGDALAQRAVRPEGLCIHRFDDGTLLTQAPMLGFGDAPYLALRRADLQAVLLEAVAARGIAITLGHPIESVHDDGKQVLLRARPSFDRHEAYVAPLVIGADGHRSVLRTAMGNTKVLPSSPWHASSAWRVMLPTQLAPALFRKPYVRLWLGKDKHVVTYPVASGTFINVVLVGRGSFDQTGWDSYDSDLPASQHFRSACAPLAELHAAVLAQAPASGPIWGIWPLSHRPPETMARGRIALVGDAAHPVLPFLAQGGALAIEDGAVLASCLKQNQSQEVALRLYRQLREPRAKAVFNGALSNGTRYHMGWPVSLARDAAIKALGPRLMQRYDWLYGWRLQNSG